VDRHLAVTARHNRLPALGPVVHEARLRCDRDQAAAVEQHALEHRGVWLDHRESTATTLVTARMDTLDALDPPTWMRETVVLWDRHCAFPGCPTDARSCDLDHLQPYVPPDAGGPPGQTSPANLACLC
jgi:hypothetical protein